MSIALAASNLTKEYPGVKALSEARLTLNSGSVHGLLGENGAGKSTMVKILTGVVSPDSGVLLVDGVEHDFRNPNEAVRAGIGAVHQERNVIPMFSVAENITLQDPPSRRGFLNEGARLQIVQDVLEILDLNVDPQTQVSDLSVAQIQLIEIGKALVLKSKVLILDEPTASLTDNEAERLFTALRRLRDAGTAILFVSHKLEEVFGICDTVTILRDGVTVVDSEPLQGYGHRDIVNLMVGRELAQRDVRLRSIDRTVVPKLSVRSLTTELGHHDITFDVFPGEIFGLYGLVGAGRSELVRSILGVSKVTGGQIVLDGGEITIRSVGEALHRHRIGYVTEDRKGEGLFLGMTVRYNVASTIWRRISGWFGVSRRREALAAEEAIDRLSIRVSSAEQLVGQLSGGNQQKVSLSKWLTANVDLLIVDEPTVGVDVRTKENFQEIILDLADTGVTIILIDSDLPEMVVLADRIAIVHNYEIVDVIENDKVYEDVSRAVMSSIHEPGIVAEG